MSAIDSELKAGSREIADLRPAVSRGRLNRHASMWWVSAVLGLMLTLAGLFLPSLWWAALGAGVLLVSGIGLLDRYAVINVRPRRSGKDQIQNRIEIYYKRGQELYARLGNDSTISAQDTRQFIADQWVNPVTEYLRGTLGERKATYFLSIARVQEPDEESVTQLGYPKARARARMLRRLERLRKIAGGM